jgi:hypothetical protein
VIMPPVAQLESDRKVGSRGLVDLGASRIGLNQALHRSLPALTGRTPRVFRERM